MVDDIAKRIASLSPEKRLLLELQLQKKKGLKEPIAIIGIGCRFPGAPSPQAFWQLLKNGVDAITEVPSDRWDIHSLYDENPATPGKMYCRWGGFLEQVDRFDPEFFGIAPREAAYIDPQQRLLLEVVWEALEDAGQVPSQLSGTKTGVFVGVSTNDYGQLLLQSLGVVDTYTATGIASTMTANRISYLLNFRGPSLAVDTACSSSLVAVHLACQSLWNGESTLALAGGVNLILTPALTVGFSKLTALSPDGRCFAFDARANGFVRGEGAGMVVLKPLSQAIASGDSIYALIPGSAVNQDGRTNGLTAPSREAQEAVLLEAYQRAGISPGQVQYIEAHGTGTLLGDPIEARALGNVLARDRKPNNPVRLGSVKTNIGHLEAAAGIASLIKVALCLKHRELLPTIHFQKPNPHIPFDQLPLRVQQTCEPWTEESGQAIAGISSFGFGGTNAHVVLKAVPDLKPAASDVERPQHLLTLSAKNEDALKALGQQYVDFLTSQADVSLADICFTANTGRSHFTHRLAVTAASPTQLQERLAAFVAGEESFGLIKGQPTSPKHPKIVFLFTGQGSQYPNMGRELLNTQPVFRQALERCDELLRPYLEQPLLSVLYPESDTNLLLHETAYTQPALFALEYALAQLWQSWGIVPDAVMGHSVGEYVAACVAGVFSLEDGLKLIAARGRLMQALPQDGMMAAVFADAVQVAEALAPYKKQVSVAGFNGPENIVISGVRDAVEAVLDQLQLEGIDFKPLQVSHAFHSPLMDPMLDAFEQVARQVQFAAPRLPLVSNLTGKMVQSEEITDASYWRHHLREAVQFAASMETLDEQGYELFVELGPSPVLLGMGKRCLPEGKGVWLPSLRKPSNLPTVQGQDDWQQLLESLGSLYVHGVSVDWAGFDRAYPRRRVTVPTYPFQRSRYWLEAAIEQGRNSLPHSLTPSPSPEELDKAEPLADWLYEVAWRPKSRLDWHLKPLSPDYMPLPSQIAQDVESQVSSLMTQHGLARYEALGHELDVLSAAYVLNAFHQLGWQPHLSERVSVASLAQQLGVVEQHHRLLGRMLQILQEDGMLKQVRSEWEVCQVLTVKNPEELRQAILSQYPACEAELTLLGRCGQQLAAVLKGQCDPLELLFPEGSTTAVERLYQDSPVAQVLNTLVREAIATALAQLPKDRPVRILELGAGTGGTTSYILPKLPANRTQYVFTDLSTLFTAKAAQKFRDYPFIEYQLLDIEQDPSYQGFAAHQFDLIVAANVLHATGNLRPTLSHVQQLLAPEGLLVLLEGTGPQRWMDLIFGLTEGWWKFADTDLRASHPLLLENQWLDLLEQVGFTEAAAIPAAAQSREILSQQAIILARGSKVGSGNGVAESSPTPYSLLPTPSEQGNWLILSDEGGVGSQLAKQLRSRGDRCILVSPGTAYEQLEAGDYQIDPANPTDFQRLLREALVPDSQAEPNPKSKIQNLKSVWNVVHLWSLDAMPPEKTTAATLETASVLGCRSTLHLLQALVKAELPKPPRLWLVTQKAKPVGLEIESADFTLGMKAEPSTFQATPSGNADAPNVATASLSRTTYNSSLAVAQSPLWGLGGAIAKEHPELWGGLVDLDRGSAEVAASTLLAQICHPDGEDQVAFRKQQRYVPRLTRSQKQQTSTTPLQFRDDSTYLITGGLGGLGLKVAHWMVERGARHLVLVGRSASSPAASEAVQKLELLGVQVVVQQVDVSEEAQVAKLLNEISHSLPPLRGIIHSAGILDDGVLLKQDWGQFVKVLRPKVEGAWNLHALTQEMPLDFFVLFSSAAALLSPPGQANHAAANTFLDALAHYRQLQGLPALSINWGAWAEVGVVAKPDVGKRLMMQGVDTIAWKQGIEVLEQLMQQSAVQVGVLPVQWKTFIEQLPSTNELPFLSELAGETGQQESDKETEQTTSAILEQLLELPLTKREEFLRSYLQQQTAKALGMAGEVPCDRNLMDLGMDSLMVVEILNACKRDLQLTLYPRELYERPTIASLAQYLAVEVERAHGKGGELQPTSSTAPDESIETWAWSNSQRVPKYTKPTKRNPSAVFILSSPRAGSTLLRVMLAGHPALFSPPELHLLPFDGMAERSQELGLSYLGEGLQRAFMELMHLDANASKALVEDLTQQDLSIQEVYAKLQELAGTRLLVDKSPTYAGSLRTLQRAEELFEGAKYIHLVRHPYSVIDSFVRNRMDKIFGISELDPYFVAEQVWATSYHNVLEFLQQVEPSRHHLIRYEELVGEPAKVMGSLCEFLEIPFDEAVLQPYQGKRMTDGVHAQSLPLDDPNFRNHNKIDSTLGEVWRKVKLPKPLGELTRQVAAQLQYELPMEGKGEKENGKGKEVFSPTPYSLLPTPSAAGSQAMRELYLDVRGLRLCLCSWGPEAGPLLLCLHGILEHGGAWEGVAAPLANMGYRVVAPDQRGHGRSQHVEMGGSYQLLDYLGDVDAIARQLTDEPFTLVGHSIGSAIAATFASARPEQVGTLVLVEPVLPAQGNDHEAAQQLATHLNYLASPPKHPVFADLKTAGDRLRQKTPSMSEEFALKTAMRLTEPCDGGLRWRWDPWLQIRTGIGFSGTAFSRDRYAKLLQQIQAPIALIYGDNSDFNKPEDLALQQASMPQAKRVIVSGGHNLPIDAPDALAAIIAEAAAGKLLQK